ncbi:hypothetical protein Tsubulata_023649 [Turnera subulata]|uniref:SnoaL-like domain-containing protein n=1 Tax=Turnera subulata TaxID=218843 RepID=A0A9Q0J404_9ROSI|nr:hypothetical protein Tsubulata_023649 [Turnera subulata]
MSKLYSFLRFPSSITTNSRTCLAASKEITTATSHKRVGSEDKEQKRMEESRGSYGNESSNPHVENKHVADDILPHILNLYGYRPTARDFEIYAPNASFEDPLMCARGVEQIKSAFYSISKVFSDAKMIEYSVKENAVSPGKQEILIDNKQRYKFLGRDIDMVSLIRLYVEDGKVVRHEDCWDKEPIGNRDTIKFPLVGLLKEKIRRGSMLVTHAMMGFGKDPTSS